MRLKSDESIMFLYFYFQFLAQLGVLALENSTNVLVRESVETTCMVEGKPSPSVTWLKDGTELGVNMSNMMLGN